MVSRYLFLPLLVCRGGVTKPDFFYGKECLGHLLLSLSVLFVAGTTAAPQPITKPASGITTKAIKTLKPPRQQRGGALLPAIVDIPSGCFGMGSPETELGRSDNEVLHRVCVQAFKLAKHEVTIAEFKQFVAATRYVTDAEQNREEQGCWSYQQTAESHWDWWQWANWKTPVQGHELREDEPVTCVSFEDVTAYIDWLNKETDQHYRLPTEAEWEYAARAGTATARYWGNNPDIACAYANVADESKSTFGVWLQPHHCEDGHFFSVAVTALHANKFGLHNMLGNAWEWTCSSYDEKYSGKETRCIVGKPRFEDMIVIRGGGWNADADRARAAYRNWGTAWSRQANLGFRLVREY